MNTHEQLKRAVEVGIIAKQQAVAVSYHACPTGRMGMADYDKARVWSPLFDTDTNAHWHDRNAKTFTGNRKESLPKALQWATEQYGITEWKGNAMGDKIPAIVHKKIPMKRST